MLALADHWVWDSWYFDDGEYFHCFFLRASKSLIDPQRRHFRAATGHARSKDLKNWELLPDALCADDAPAWDSTSTWTGSVIQDPATQLFHLFYTGTNRLHGGVQQQVGHATSTDLIQWKRDPKNPIVSADPAIFETLADNNDEPFRDPWVFYDANDQVWKMLLTANLKELDNPYRATIALVTSNDLYSWSKPIALLENSGFGQIEVTQVEEIDGKWVLIFCVAKEFIKDQSPEFQSGTFSAPADSPTGPFHLDRAELIGPAGLYAGRIIKDRKGDWNLLGFIHDDFDKPFTGRIQDPVLVSMTSRGTLQP